LERARGGSSAYNEAFVVTAFVERGIAEADIKPRENVLTFDAWRALGRHVRKGEKSVRVRCFYNTEPKVDQASGDELPGERRMTQAYLFHVSQTDADDDQAGDDDGRDPSMPGNVRSLADYSRPVG
jgi:antirestriction protein ArdC